ncbi:hypothetical protein M8J76_014703 [Diaphorina citri]|nr:hypothetical protein M8J76_014703 [Diaphorina citri]
MSFIYKANLLLGTFILICLTFKSTTGDPAPDPQPDPQPDPEPEPFLDIQIKPKHHRHHHHHFHHFRRNHHPYMDMDYGRGQTVINIQNSGFSGFLLRNAKTIALMFFYIGSVLCTIMLLLKI